MTARKFVTAKTGRPTKAQQDLRKVQAFKAVFGGNSTREDADIVLSELFSVTGFFRPPTLKDWMASTKSPVGYELHCALQAARCEPLRVILNFLELGDDAMIALEKAAREARS